MAAFIFTRDLISKYITEMNEYVFAKVYFFLTGGLRYRLLVSINCLCA